MFYTIYAIILLSIIIMKLKLTIFTCTYNRKHTIERTYRSLLNQTCKDFLWLIIDDGSSDGTNKLVDQWKLNDNGFTIKYIYKKNQGLLSGYNKAIENMNSELCVCIDSDDWMPNDGVENIIRFWDTHGTSLYAGIIGLDFYNNNEPIGGFFPDHLKESYIYNLYKWHHGDVKMVHRVDLLKKYTPIELYPGEKFANPIYIYMLVDLSLPMLITNHNFCYVEYQENNDSMSKNILYQFAQSPRSFARIRLLNMGNTQLAYRRRFRNAIHYISSCLLSHDRDWFKNSPMKISTILAVPFGIFLYCYIKYQLSNNKTAYH